MSASPAISLLDKYPHLRLLAARRLEDVTNTKDVDGSVSLEAAGEGSRRISLLGPGVGGHRPPVVLPPRSAPRGRVVAEQLFAASVAADDDQWLQFQVEEDVPARQQIDSLNLWLVANRPSTIARSAGVGWIAVKFKDKGKKVLEAKAAWDNYEAEKTMEVVNKLAEEFKVMGGKWMCHLPSGLIDDVWSKLATALMCGGLGPSVYMVKVSPVEDIDPNLARGEHVICVYNTDYKDTEQVMRVENLMRSAGVATILNYKPDIFSALGIYRNNKWGFRPTIYSSKVLMMEGKSRVETVGTGKWYYNSSKGLHYPSVDSRGDFRSEKENMSKGRDAKQIVKNGKESAAAAPGFCLESMDKLKGKQDKGFPPSSVDKLISDSSKFSMDSVDMMKKSEHKSEVNGNTKKIMKGKTEHNAGWSHRLIAKKNDEEVKKVVGLVDVDVSGSKIMTTQDVSKADSTNLPGFSMSSLDMMKISKETVGESSEHKSGWSHRLTAKKNNNVGMDEGEDGENNTKCDGATDNHLDCEVKKSPGKGWRHRLAVKQDTNNNVLTVTNKAAATQGVGESRRITRVEKDDSVLSEVLKSGKSDAEGQNHKEVKKPAWLKKLEEMKLKTLDDMKTK